MTNRITAASQALRSCQNADGGIAATQRGDSSGCWTTSATLEAVITTGRVFDFGFEAVKRMAEFLMSNQIVTGIDEGSWPMQTNSQGSHGVTMATGHALTALILSSALFQSDPSFTTKVQIVVAKAIAWLQKNQNADGGWGVEPAAGGKGVESMILSSHYAMLHLAYTNKSFRSINRAKAITFFKDSMNPDKYFWGTTKRAPDGTVSDTARALISLLHLEDTVNDTTLKKALSFIEKKQDSEFKGVWKIGRLELLLPGAGSASYYTNNSIVDVVNVLSLTGESLQTLESALQCLLVEHEGGTGFWHLSSRRDPPNPSMYTWPTAEWMMAVNAAALALVNALGSGSEFKTHLATRKRVFTKERCTIFLIGIGLGCVPALLPETWREKIIKFLLSVVLIGVVTNLLSDGIKMAAGKLLKQKKSYVK